MPSRSPTPPRARGTHPPRRSSSVSPDTPGTSHREPAAGDRWACRCRGVARRVPERASVGNGNDASLSAAPPIPRRMSVTVRWPSTRGRARWPARVSEVAQGEFGKGLVAVEAARRGRDRRRACRAARRRAARAAQHTVQLEMREQGMSCWPVSSTPRSARAPERSARVRSDASARIASAASVSAVMRSASGRSCWSTVGSTRGAAELEQRHCASSACIVLPGRTQHVGPQHATVGDRVGQVALAR